MKDKSESIKFVKDDSELLNEPLNLQNQRVIKNDCDRTRVKDKPLLASFREYLESFLSFATHYSLSHYTIFIILKLNIVNLIFSRIYPYPDPLAGPVNA